jgi:hypothetical protein
MLSNVLAYWRPAFEAFLADPGLWGFLASWARGCPCLPVYRNWTHAFGVMEEGDVVVFQYEPWPGVVGPPDGRLTDIRWMNVAIHEGMKRYPWLKELLPPRPADAQECSMCSGTGTVPPEFICYCGGSGWVPASDTWVNRDR